LAGKVIFELTIDPSGRVLEVKIVTSELNSPKLEAKLVRLLKTINFGSKDVDTLKLTYPLDFIPQ
jgi:hypothetical protein